MLRAHVGLIVRPWEEVGVNVSLPLVLSLFVGESWWTWDVGHARWGVFFCFGEAEKTHKISFHDPLSSVLWKEKMKRKKKKPLEPIRDDAQGGRAKEKCERRKLSDEP